MPWVLMTPLGRPVEPEVNRNFAIVSAPLAAAALSTAGPAGVRSEVVERRRAEVGAVAARDDFGAARPTAASALANGAVSAT